MWMISCFFTTTRIFYGTQNPCYLLSNFFGELPIPTPMIPPFYTPKSLAQLATQLGTIPSTQAVLRALLPTKPVVDLANCFPELDGSYEIALQHNLLDLSIRTLNAPRSPHIVALSMAIQRFANAFSQIIPPDLPVATPVTDWEALDVPPASRIFIETAQHLQYLAREGWNLREIVDQFGRLVAVSEKRRDPQAGILRRYYDLMSDAIREQNDFVARYLAQGASSWLVDVSRAIEEHATQPITAKLPVTSTQVHLTEVPVLDKKRKEIGIDIATLGGIIQCLAATLRSLRNLEEKTAFCVKELSWIAADFAQIKTFKGKSAQTVVALFERLMEKTGQHPCHEETIQQLDKLASKLMLLAAEDIRKQLMASPGLALQIWGYSQQEPGWEEIFHFTRNQILIGGGSDELLREKTRKEHIALYLLLTHGVPCDKIIGFLKTPKTKTVSKREFLEIIVDLYNLGVPNFANCFLALGEMQKKYNSDSKSPGIHHAAQYAEFLEARALAAHPANRQVSLSHWMFISWGKLNADLKNRTEQLKIGPGRNCVANYEESQTVGVDILVRSNGNPPRLVEIKNSTGNVYGKGIQDATRLELQAISLGLAAIKYEAEGIELVVAAEGIHQAVLDLYKRIWGTMKIPHVIIAGKGGEQTILRNSGLQPLPRARLESYDTGRPLPSLPFDPEDMAWLRGR